MKKPLLVGHCLLLMLLLSFAAVPSTHAQATWSAWLHNKTEARMTLVGAEGMIDEFILPLPAGFDVYPDQVAVAPDGLHMAYIASQSTTAAQQLVVYDHTLRAIVATYDPATAGGVVSGFPAFSPNSQRVAFGYSLAEGWEIINIDLPTFSIADALRYDDPAVQGIGLPTPPPPGLAPSIQGYRDNLIAFVYTPLGMDDTSYQWQLDT
ncbi:MAG TPA: hypothetical protein VHL11_16670, partial [Phototrophicaceae bacterium]|nr:hypothetical protein [Phototrophicaceae bacterium]